MFYTNVAQHFDDLLITEISEDGKKKRLRHKYQPYVFEKSDVEKDNFFTLDGQRVGKFYPGTMLESSRYTKIRQTWWGLTTWPYQYIYETYQASFLYDVKAISVVSIDIEVAADEGFPNIERADKPVTLITISRMSQNRKYVFGCGEFRTDRSDVHYFKCANEQDLLKQFLHHWRSDAFDPDIVTGWNSEGFDIPYLHNRIMNTMGKTWANRMSPWNVVQEREVIIMGRVQKLKTLVGISQLDYLALYKKFSYTPQPSYKLDHIANAELGERKLDYSEYQSLQGLYLNDFQKYTEYNIRDVELVDKLEQKKKFIEQVIAIAYRCRINFQDAMTTVRLWDITIHNYLMDRNIVIPPMKINEEVGIPGGYVKDPILGLHKWILTYDVASLYPHIFMQVNISPETFRHRVEGLTVDGILNGQYDDYRDEMLNSNLSIAASGCMFDRTEEGFLSALMRDVFEERSKWKKSMLQYENELEHTEKDTKEYLILINKIDQAKNMQQALKIVMNSCYGALMNAYNRWFDPKLGESITLTGQAVIRYIEVAINKFLNKVMSTENVDYVVAIDTDSVHVSFDKIVDKIAKDKNDTEITGLLDQISKKQIEPMIDKTLKKFAEYSNAFKPAIYMKREVIANRAIWVAKKRYAMTILDKEGVRYEKPKMKIQGLEVVRSSTPIVCRNKLEQAIEIVLLKDETTLRDFVSKFKREFAKLRFVDVAFPRTANDLEKYADEVTVYAKKTPIHVKGALLFNYWLKNSKMPTIQPIRSGDKIKFAYLKNPNFLNNTVIAAPSEGLPPEMNLDAYIDVHKQFTKAFLEPLEHIIESTKWKAEKVDTVLDLFGELE